MAFPPAGDRRLHRAYKHRERRMPHLRSHEADVLVGAEQQRRVSVPALVERPMAQSSAAKQPNPVALAQLRPCALLLPEAVDVSADLDARCAETMALNARDLPRSQGAVCRPQAGSSGNCSFVEHYCKSRLLVEW